jgi:hypothetical protein
MKAVRNSDKIFMLVFLIAGLWTIIALGQDNGSAPITRQAIGQQRFDRKWWTSVDSDEQQGFIIGFSDCYGDTLRRKVTSDATNVEFLKAMNDFYTTHTDQNPTEVPELVIRLSRTLKSSVHHLPGAEVWNEPHGYLDGQYWNESTEKERLGFLEGYIKCYQDYARRPRVRFSCTAAEYSGLLTRYFENPSASADHTDEKIAHVLHRFGESLSPARNQKKSNSCRQKQP